MGSVNKIVIVGRVKHDMTTFSGDNGFYAMTMYVVTTENMSKKGSAERINVTYSHRVVLFGKMAAFASKNVAEGDIVAVTGRLCYKRYADNNGVERHVTEIFAKEFALISASGESNPQPQEVDTE